MAKLRFYMVKLDSFDSSSNIESFFNNKLKVNSLSKNHCVSNFYSYSWNRIDYYIIFISQMIQNRVQWLKFECIRLSQYETMHGGRICSGGGALTFFYLILIHQLDNFGGLRWAEAAWYEWVHWLPLWRPPIACKRGLRVASWGEAAWYECVHWLPLWWPANSCSVISNKLCQT